jgi:hypothetical protein
MSSSSSRVVDAKLTRRQFSIATAVAGAGLILPMRSSAVFAQEQDLSSVDLPTLDINVTANGYEGIPESLEAGRYLVTVTAGEDTGEFGAGVAFIQPAGMTGDEFIEMLGQMSGPPDESGVGSAAATPIEGGAAEASPAAAGGEMMGPPPFMFESVMAGGTYAPPGQSSRVVLDLTPGSWVAWGDDPASPQQPVAFEATGEMPAEPVQPESTATLTMFEYDIQVTEGELTTGSYVVRVDNVGAQPHYVGIVKVRDGLTEDQLMTALDEEMQAGMSGTPTVYSDFNPNEEAEDVAFSGTQSNATSQWIELKDVQAGTYVLICFYPDIQDGMPHAFHDMYAIVEITE